MTNNLIKLSNFLRDNQLKIAVAESCTAGALASKLTQISGSSDYFDLGLVTYSNQAKHKLLGVDNDTIKEFGVVSPQVVAQMATGVVAQSGSDIAIAISGITGPTGGTKHKPVGMVCFGFSIKNRSYQYTKHFYGSRAMIVKQSVDFAIETTNDLIH